MENTLINKSKFFAHCLGQKVEIHSVDFQTEGVNDAIIDNIISIDISGQVETTQFHPPITDVMVIKKPLSIMTDEDAIELARIALYHPDIDEWDEKEVWIGEGDIDNKGNHTLQIGMRCWEGVLTINDQTGSVKIRDDDRDEHIYNSLNLYDYLRSKGYALPYMGLSVEKQIEYGWIKLKEG